MLWVTTSAFAAIRCATSRPGVRLEVDRDRALAARGGVERLGRGSERVAVERFELDHVGAQIGEQPARVRPGEVQPEVEHLQLLQRREHVVLPPQPMTADRRSASIAAASYPSACRISSVSAPGTRCAAADRARRAGEARGHADLLELAQLGVAHAHGGVVVRDLRLVEDLGGAMHRDRGDVGGAQPLLPVVAGLAREDLRVLPGRRPPAPRGSTEPSSPGCRGRAAPGRPTPARSSARACEPFAPVCTPRYSPSPQMKLPTRSRRDGARALGADASGRCSRLSQNIVMNASTPSNIDVSTRWPRPVDSRATRAAPMPITARRPAPMPASGTPG